MNISEVIKMSEKTTNFSEKELKKARKALKKAGIPKPWYIHITNTETGETDVYEL